MKAEGWRWGQGTCSPVFVGWADQGNGLKSEATLQFILCLNVLYFEMTFQEASDPLISLNSGATKLPSRSNASLPTFNSKYIKIIKKKNFCICDDCICIVFNLAVHSFFSFFKSIFNKLRGKNITLFFFFFKS